MESSQSDSNIFSVRIVSIDYYMAPPIADIDICYSSFQGGKVNEVPVIRIYGSTPAGQKTCLHVHRALPYLYVPCSDISLETPKEGDMYIHVISRAIEKALKRKGCSGSKRQHVHGCSLVRGRKFYGYHSSEELFVKIYLYYPHEVARVATLLLGAAVLGKSFQPHESHIPYLLQFLVDYNLYGMGHLHVSKVKFRHPLPDDFIPRAAHHSGKCSSTDACIGSPIWISSTIPCGWMWPIPVEHDSLLDQDLHLIKRQSTCELEGDATVDEILNQHYKMYSSLSQTRSEVKMVQSLIPIWEEEYGRTGMHEEVISPDPSKPLPENVLRTLSHVHEFETALLDLCREAENLTSSQGTPSEKSEKFVQSIRSLTEVGNFAEFVEHVNPNWSDGESSECFEERCRNGSMLSQASLLKQDDDAIPSEWRDVSPEIVPVDKKKPISEKIEMSDPKVIDTEALGLLRWFASSQAAEDLITDDELVHNIILSPLLPTTTIDKVLEKANLDYECESQQECQDILDSVEYITDSEVLMEQAIHFTGRNHLPQTSLENMIPQVDGSFDDQLTEHVGNSSEIEMNSELERSSHQGLQNTCIGLNSEKKSDKRIWGSLPLSTQQKESDDLESTSFYSTDISNEMKSGTTPSSSSGNKLQKLCDDSMTNVNTDISGLKEGNKLTRCSMRDLMRRKRSYRVEPSEQTCGFKKNFLGKEQEETSLNPKRLEFQIMQNDMGTMMPRKTFVKPLVTDQQTAADDQSSCATTCASEVWSKVYGVGPAHCNFPMYGKLPFLPHNGSSLQASTLKNGPFCSHERPDDIVCVGDPAEFDSIKMTDPSLLLTETREMPESVNSVKQDSAFSTSLNEYCKVKKESVSGSRGLLTYFNETNQDCCAAMKRLPEMSSDSHGNINAASDANALQNENCVIVKQDMQNFVSSPISSLSTVVYTEKRPVEYIEMTLSKKPPMIDQIVGISEDTSFAAAVHNHTFIVDVGNSEGTLDCNSNLPYFRGRGADKILPFFVNKVQDEQVYDKPYKDKVLDFHQETVLGLPTHYQNDGSFSYLLTTVFSPPSVDSVYKWLSHLTPQNTKNDATGTSKENFNSALLEQPSMKHNNSLGFVRKENNSLNDGKASSEALKLHTVLSSDMINSQGFLINPCHGTIPESGSVPNVEPFLDQFGQENYKNLHTEVNLSHNEVTTELYIKGSKMEENEHTESWQDISQISGPGVRSKLTPLSQIGFRDPASVGAGQQLTLLSIEVQAESRGDLRPDPRFDAINVIALAIQEDNGHVLEAFVLLRGNDEESCQRNIDGISGCKVLVAFEEKQLYNHFVKIVRSFDPDILMGWEIQGGSLGFLAERAAHLGIVLLNNISRTPSETKSLARNSETLGKGIPDDQLAEALLADSIVFEDAIIEDEWGRTHASGVHVGGRIVLNIWRLMRSEVKLTMYTIEAVAEEVLRRKIPSIPFRILTQWFSSGPGRARFHCINYVLERAKLNLEIMNQLDMINRTSELARVFGIDFFSVLSRGSQYRVESMFLRLAHTQNYLAISPGKQQVASQPAMECLPLVMEPESGFYVDPVVVLDFQSLYPSMIIAYNLCFCTCLGKVVPSKANTLGVSSFLPDPQLLMDLKHQILLTPNGVMYVPSKVRKGVLPRLLEEILSTRIMVKQAMKKLTPSQRVLSKIFNARQLALKLIANVTYGYTAAGFSGRMPCAELADSIVQCGRRTLEKAISFVNSHDKWNARVIYGDTDSMFVLLKGRTVKESFRIGQEIASEVTLMNPNPVTLKMEKVYHPCFLLTKKRYVGYSYESPDQAEPSFDAKGIETVRRDVCGAVSKTLEQSLRLFFEQQDIFKVKEYLQRQWRRILGGKVSLQDFVFAKEVRLGTYSIRVSSLPPAAIVATKAMSADPRAEPRYAERIPYVVIHGEPGARLVDMVVDPLDLLRINSPFRLNDLYYINKQIIPALQRVFGLVGADLNQWFLEMPRPVRPTIGKRHCYAPNAQRTRIDYYYLSKHCILCGELVQASSHLCDRCSKKGPAVATAVIGRTSKLERDIQHLAAICQHCGGGDWIVESGVKCTSLACTVFYERRKVQKELQTLSAIATEAGFYPRCMVEWF